MIGLEGDLNFVVAIVQRSKVVGIVAEGDLNFVGAVQDLKVVGIGAELDLNSFVVIAVEGDLNFVVEVALAELVQSLNRQVVIEREVAGIVRNFDFARD